MKDLSVCKILFGTPNEGVPEGPGGLEDGGGTTG